jgi:hypothetical protein
VRLDVIRSEAGRLSGRLSTDGGAMEVAFDGTLELLRLLEELVDDESVSASPPTLGRVEGLERAPSSASSAEHLGNRPDGRGGGMR